jgi:nicotinate-nucleotide adenylyltransferase
LLGGSFNPAHEGHRHISLQALKRLGLDEIWWMVSPQNPLKPQHGMAPFPARLRSARAMARHPRIKVTGIEARLGTRYTADTLKALKRRFARARFVWLMGADNLIQIPRWEEWTAIFAAVPIAVFDRPSYSLRARGSKAAQRFSRSRLPVREAGRLAQRHPPAWVFLDGRTHPASASSIRARQDRSRAERKEPKPREHWTKGRKGNRPGTPMKETI